MLSFTMGIAAIFDLTGATVYRTIRQRLPQPPPQDPDPFRAAMATILAAHREVVMGVRDDGRKAVTGVRDDGRKAVTGVRDDGRKAVTGVRDTSCDS